MPRTSRPPESACAVAPLFARGAGFREVLPRAPRGARPDVEADRSARGFGHGPVILPRGPTSVQAVGYTRRRSRKEPAPMPSRPVARLAPIALLGLVAWMPRGGPAPAAAQPLKSVGDERVIGKNRTGEECRLRLLDRRTDPIPFERYGLFCEGWSQPSGDVRRFGVSREATPQTVLGEGWYLKSYETRVGDCKPLESTTVSAGGAAALRECRRLDGNWRVLVVGAVIGRRGYGLETFPTTLPLLEVAVEVLEGKRSIDQPGAPPLSAAIRHAETMVGASGKLIGVQDIGAGASLYRPGQLQTAP